MWHVTSDMWHLTCDRWHVIHDTWRWVNILSKFQLSSSNSLGFMIFWRSGGKGSLSKLTNDKAVCRTAPATPGLLISTQMFAACLHMCWPVKHFREQLLITKLLLIIFDPPWSHNTRKSEQVPEWGFLCWYSRKAHIQFDHCTENHYWAGTDSLKMLVISYTPPSSSPTLSK